MCFVSPWFPSTGIESGRGETGLAGVGRVRAVLRLGECANARSRGCTVLAAHRPQGGRLSARAWLRDRPDLAAAGAGGRFARRGRSIRSDAGPRRCARQNHAGPPPARRERRSRRWFAATFARFHFAAADSRWCSRLTASCSPCCAISDLVAALASVSRVLKEGGLFGLDLVPDVPNWREYHNLIQLRGRAAGGAHLTLVESVRQDRRRRLTTFEQKYLERRAGRTAEHRFELTFRTLPVRAMVRRLEAAGFVVEATLGDYRGRPWDRRSDVWLILARKPSHKCTDGILEIR